VINQKKVSIKTLNFPTKERDNIALHCFQSVLCSDGVVISIFECERLRLVFEFQMRLKADINPPGQVRAMISVSLAVDNFLVASRRV